VYLNTTLYVLAPQSFGYPAQTLSLLYLRIANLTGYWAPRILPDYCVPSRMPLPCPSLPLPSTIPSLHPFLSLMLLASTGPYSHSVSKTPFRRKAFGAISLVPPHAPLPQSSPLLLPTNSPLSKSGRRTSVQQGLCSHRNCWIQP
jgi:hypothetical protein